MAQTWHDLLFAHWPIESAVLRKLVPQALALDTFNGQAWIAVTPFHMSGIHLRGLPALPGLSRFPELNVRTYVTFDDKPGVYFFSLDAASAAAVWGARTFYHLPYFASNMSVETREQWIRYLCRRRQSSAEFASTVWPKGMSIAPKSTTSHGPCKTPKLRSRSIPWRRLPAFHYREDPPSCISRENWEFWCGGPIV